MYVWLVRKNNNIYLCTTLGGGSGLKKGTTLKMMNDPLMEVGVHYEGVCTCMVIIGMPKITCACIKCDGPMTPSFMDVLVQSS